MFLIDARVTAWVPVRTYIWKDETGEAASALAEICKDVPALVPVVRRDLTDVEASIAAPPKGLLKRLIGKSILVQAQQTAFLKVAATFTLDRDAFNQQNPGHQLDEDLFLAFGAMLLQEALETLLMLSELSHPGRPKPPKVSSRPSEVMQRG